MDKDQLQLRRQVGQLFDMIEETQRLAETTARAQDTRRTALMPGESMQIMDADGNVAAYFGGSNASGQLIEHVAGPEPKRPSAPELDSPMPGVITVVADGNDENGEAAQGNHDRVLIHLSHVEGFTPSEATAQHSFFGPEGRQDVSAEPGEWYVAIQWKTKTGQLSEPSEQVAVEVLELVNSADIQTALDEAQARLDEAKADFEAGNEERIAEIENLNDVVLPGITQALQDKADSSELGTLDETLREAFGEADKAIQAVADEAKQAATSAGATAEEADAAAAKAVADAEEAFAKAEAAERFSSEAEQAADASAKDAADALAQALAAGGDASAAQAAADAAQKAATEAQGYADTAGTAAATADANAAAAAADAAQAQADALAAAQSSTTSAEEAQAAKTRAEEAAADATAAYERAQEAEESASSASGAASAAETAADTAASQAADALTRAQAAEGDAGAAQAAADEAQRYADTAQSKADEANTAAADADAKAAQAAADAAQAQADAVAAATSSDTSASEAKAAKDRADAAASDAQAAYARAQEAEESASSASGAASAAETAADTAASQAADALSRAQAAEGDAGAAQKAADDAQRYADEAERKAEEANSKAATADANAAQAAADAAQAVADAAKAAQDAEEAKAEAEAAKEYADQQDNKIAAAAATDAQEKADEAIRQAQEALDNLEVGSRNYFLGSHPGPPFTYASNNSRTGAIQYGYEDGVFWLTGYLVESPESFYISTYANWTFERGVGISYSEDILPLPSVVTQSMEVMCHEPIDIKMGSQDEYTTLVPGVWTRLEFTYEPASRPAALTSLTSQEFPGDTRVYLRNWKLEKGHKATDWTPAPEDLQAAIDAAKQSAADAHEAAGEAHAHADAAMTRAGEAETSAKDHADSLPKVLHGTGAPSGTAPDGSIWWQHQGSLQGAVTAQWNRVGGSWVSTPIDSKAIAGLDVGKLTAGGAVISDAVIQDLTASNGAFDRLDARRGWIGGVALEDDAVTARTFNAEEVFTDKATANTVWAEVVRTGLLTAEEALIGGVLLKKDSITVDKLTGLSEILTALLRAKKIEAGEIDANAINGMTLTGNLVQTDKAASRGVKMRGAHDDIVAYDTSGKLIARIGGSDTNMLSGRLYTNAPGEPGIILNPDEGPGSYVGPGVWFSENGLTDDDQPAIWVDKSDEGGHFAQYTLNLRGRRTPNGEHARIISHGGIEADGGFSTKGGHYGFYDTGDAFFGEVFAGPLNASSLTAAGDGIKVISDGYTSFESIESGYTRFNRRAYFEQFTYLNNNVYISRNLEIDGAIRKNAQFDDNIRVEGWILNPGRPERTSGANVYMGGTGEYLWKNTSVRRSKVNIETVEGVHHRLLDLEPRIWIDRSDIEMESDEAKALIEDAGEGPRVDEDKLSELFPSGRLPRRVPGLVAEEVEAVGLEDYAVYEIDEETGEEKLQSVSYDRLWTLLIPLVREHRDRIEALEAENEVLHSRVDDLEARLAALEAKL